MTKKQYLTPAMRVKPLATEGAIMDALTISNTEVDSGWAKEMDSEMDMESDGYENYQGGSVWGD